MILYILLLVVALWRGFRTYMDTNERETKFLILTLIAGLTTYVVHGALNNFLDTDKISALFWGMIAALVSFETEKQAGEKEEAGYQ